MKKNVLILGGNHDQLEYIREIKRKGYKIFLTDINQSCPARPLSDKFYVCSYDDYEKLIDISQEIYKAGSFVIFTAAAQFAQVGAAIVAEKFSITYPKVDVIKMCLNKAKFYENFTEFGLPIPSTVVIHDESELIDQLNSKNCEFSYYLKSDFGKSPNHIYKLEHPYMDLTHINWIKDRFLRDVYLLQKEFYGDHFRVNIYPDGHSIFSFFTNEICWTEDAAHMQHIGIIGQLRRYVEFLGLSAWLIKFDVIVNQKDWVVLDIGLDPPFRMKKYLEKNGDNFSKQYVEQYLEGKISYCSYD